MKSPQLGFSFHPKWLSLTGSAEAFLRPLQEAGMTAVEFTLHPTDLDWEAFPPLIMQCQRMGLHCHFHAPYLDPYNVAGFSGDGQERVKALFYPAIILAERFAAYNDGPTVLVVHGARAADRSHRQLFQDTGAFLEWLLSRNSGLRIALENLPRNHALIKIGTSRQELLDIIEAVASSDVGMCWDLGHDMLLGATAPPNEACLRRVIHVHVHDINAMGIDHHPLVYGLVPYRSWLQPLVRAGFNGCVTLEVNGQHVGCAKAEQIEEMLVSSLHCLAEVIGRY